MLERTFSNSSRRRVPAFPPVESEDTDASRVPIPSFLPWPLRDNEMSVMSAAAPASLSMPPTPGRQPEGGSSLVQGASSSKQTDRWPEMMHNLSSEIRAHSGLPHSAVDQAQIHHLDQLELQNLQRYGHLAGVSPMRQVPQQQQPMPQVLAPQHQVPSGAGPLLEQLLRPGLPRDLANLGMLQQHHHQQQPQHHQQQVPLPIPPSGPGLDQLLRLQQQQQQQLPPQVLIEQLLRQHPHLPQFDQGPRHPTGSANSLAEQLVMRPSQDAHHLESQPSRAPVAPRVSTLEQLFQSRHPQNPSLDQLMLHRQDDQVPGRHLGLQVPQRPSLDEIRISGVWEVDEFGQFVRTQAPPAVPPAGPSPMHPFDLQQQQQQQQRVQTPITYAMQLSQPPHQPEARGGFPYDKSQQQDKVLDGRASGPLFDPNLLSLERSLSAITGNTRIDGDLASHFQEHRRIDRQSSLPFSESSRSFSSDVDKFHSQPFHLQGQDGQLYTAGRGWPGAASIADVDTGADRRPQQHQHQQQEEYAGQKAEQFIAASSEMGSSVSEQQARQSALSRLNTWGLLHESQQDNLGPQDSRKAAGESMLHPELITGPNWRDNTDLRHQEHVTLSHPSSEKAAILPTPAPISSHHQAAVSGGSAVEHDTGLVSGWSLGLSSEPVVPHGVSATSQISVPPVWRPGPSPKPKSLMEIQQEEAERRRAEEKLALEAAARVSSTNAVNAGSLGPWASSTHLAHAKSLREIQEEEAHKTGVLVQSTPASQSPYGGPKNELSWSVWPPATISAAAGAEKPVGAHDAVAEDATKKTTDTPATHLPAESLINSESITQSGVVLDDSEFLEPKESKKSKKRASKAKVAAAAKSAPVVISEPSPPVLAGKTASSKQSLLDGSKDVLSPTPAVPSLADFMLVKDEASSSQPPAWSTDANKQGKPAKSLKEIQELEKRAREEQDKHLQAAAQLQASAVAAGAKPLISRSSSGGASAWQRPSVTSPQHPGSVQNSLVNPALPVTPASSASRSKTGVFVDDDDLFWDYSEDVTMTIGPVKQAPKTER